MKSSRGFSLVEILLVLGLMGILATVVLMNFGEKKPERVVLEEIVTKQFAVENIGQPLVFGTNFKIVTLRSMESPMLDRIMALADVDRVLLSNDTVAVTKCLITNLNRTEAHSFYLIKG